jgi:hypothetical protein
MKQIRQSKFTKIVAYYLMIMMCLQVTQPMQMYALTSGPKQPEFTAFTPIGTSDMVNLSSGDFNYNIPIMDVGGYPINLAYNSGITMDQEASWVGLGWNLNVGEISRQVRGLPDDFRGDQMVYENSMRSNFTVGTNINLSPAVFGNNFPFSFGLGVQYNNSEGVTFQPSIGMSYNLAGNVQVGVNLTSAVGEGATVSPSISVSEKAKEAGRVSNTLGASFGVDLSSRKGLENMSISVSNTRKETTARALKDGGDYSHTSNSSIGGSISFNNQSYTPTKRIGFVNNSRTFNATIGGEVFGIEGEVRLSGYGSYQRIADKYERNPEGAYGYENTQYKNGNEGVLDFNREKEQTVSKNTNALPVTNYTYDIYNIEGQGVSGMFRPYRSQVGYLYNDNVSDFSETAKFGAEIGIGNLVHGGIDSDNSVSTSITGLWKDNNYALPFFAESDADKNPALYEQTAFKLVGELNVDNEIGVYKSKVNETKPLAVQLEGGFLNRVASSSYLYKEYKDDFTPILKQYKLDGKIKREGRILRNQNIQKVTNAEADEKFIFKNANANPHHTAGIKVLKPDGSTYVFGKTVYNKTKVEASFDVSGANQNTPDQIKSDLIPYNGSLKQNHSNNSDKYVNRITTPAYAHSYLITSVLSADYEDIDNNGPTDSDLGSYTKFSYVTPVADYKWRVPYGLNIASYNEGLKTSKRDQKGSYIYGEKELTYLNTIQTKTHIAIIDLENRKDAMGVLGQNGGQGGQAMMRIKSIRLYSKPELKAAGISISQALDVNSVLSIKPIKTAHFEYDYSLCGNIPANNGVPENVGSDNLNKNKGKLTLKKLYFTYRSSNMGKFTPYMFNYSQENPNYDIKGYDIWGNYKANNDPHLTTSEFPFVEQDQNKANSNTSAWVLKSIELPSGGTIAIETESDDYQYVQNRKAMQMFKVVGAGDSNVPPSTFDNKLYSSWGDHQKYIYVKVKDKSLTKSEFINKYLQENLNKPIYFRFLLNMNKNQGSSDYVSGYFEIDPDRMNDMLVDASGIASIPLKFLRMDGGLATNAEVNPIAKAGWGFGRTFLNRSVYSPGGDEVNDDFVSIVSDLVGSLGAVMELFTGPNLALQIRQCAQEFDINKSWVRLENPDGHKLGGGLRVKKIVLSDNWSVMNAIEKNSVYDDLFGEEYGQEYTYNLDNGKSSGVATYEPNASKENPFVLPFYGIDGNYAERIGAPKELNYVEEPFGENFFPSPTITYSRVTVANLTKKNLTDDKKVIKKHATGRVVTEHYTSLDFPTIVDFTNIILTYDKIKSPLFNLLMVTSLDHLVASQGFSIETNDMNGKVRSEMVYGEDKKNDPENINNPTYVNKPISKVIYKYNVDSKNRLNNDLTTINSKGEVSKSLIGVDYDVINDFNESKSTMYGLSINSNLACFLAAIFPVFVPVPLPKFAYHENMLRTATTTKVVHKTGIMVEKIAYDLGSQISTKNLAWDARTGQVLLTQTINEFDDKYYSFNYPAYWYYSGMGLASDNIDFTGVLKPRGSSFGLLGLDINQDISKYFKIGDELLYKNEIFWVGGYDFTKSSIKLMDRNGSYKRANIFLTISNNNNTNNTFKIVRSGNRNMQMASMASVTSMLNPIDKNNDGVLESIDENTFKYVDVGAFDSKVINASAIEYSDDWKSQCENGLPNEWGLTEGATNSVNPFVYNIKGDWRAIKSYAYLTGRNNFVTTNRRKSGYFIKFDPFYLLSNNNNNKTWSVNRTNWRFASKVSKYSPYGVELENVDALDRYSAAQYGYNYTLPVAVSSNSKYSEMGFDGFEDYYENSVPQILKPHFGFSQGLAGGNVFITDQKSHTGHKSMAITAGNRVTFTRKIEGCKTPSQNQNAKAKVVVK